MGRRRAAEDPADPAHPGRDRGVALLVKRGLNRREAADYVGVSVAKFDELVADNRMPQPKKIDGRLVWDRFDVDDAFESLPERAAANPWDDVL